MIGAVFAQKGGSQKMSKHYYELPEVLTIPETAELMGVSAPIVREWFKTEETPFGKVKLGFHYFKAGREPRIVKDRICEMAGILPKGVKNEN